MRPKDRPLASTRGTHGSPIVASYSVESAGPAGSVRALQLPNILEGRVQSSSTNGPFVEWSGSPAPTLARVLWMQCAPDWSRCIGLRVALAFEGGQESRPVIVGLFDAPPPDEPTHASRE